MQTEVLITVKQSQGHSPFKDVKWKKFEIRKCRNIPPIKFFHLKKTTKKKLVFNLFNISNTVHFQKYKTISAMIHEGSLYKRLLVWVL